jgi:WD40 repeat protein
MVLQEKTKMKTSNKRIVFLAASIAFGLAFPGTILAAEVTLYTFAFDVTTEHKDRYLATIDPATAEISIINPDKPFSKDKKVSGLDFSPCAGMDGNIYGAGGAELREYDIGTGKMSVALSPLTGDLTGATAFAFHPDGRLFAANNGLDALYELDLSTGGSTLIGPVGFDMRTSGMDFAPDGTLYLIEGGKGETPGTHSLYTVDIETGTATLVGPVGFAFGATDIAIADDGTLYISGGGVEVKDPDGKKYGPTLFTVDPTSGEGTIIGKLKTGDFKADVAALGWGPVEDTVPPKVVCSVNPEVLWPPNHRMVSVIVLIVASDTCTQTEDLTVVVTVESSEPDDDNGDGASTGDVDGEDGFTAPVEIPCEFDEKTRCFVSSFELRAERAGGGDGRVYTIHVVCTDASGNTGEPAMVDVTVPHDQGKGKK